MKAKPRKQIISDDSAREILENFLDSSDTASSCITPGFEIENAIDRSMRRVDRKMRLDELDEIT